MNNFDFIARIKYRIKQYLWKKIWWKSVLAGIMIGLAGIVNLNVDNKFIGAFLFSFGLITILAQNLNLYTGKVGTINLSCEWFMLPVIILGNFFGN